MRTVLGYLVEVEDDVVDDVLVAEREKSDGCSRVSSSERNFVISSSILRISASKRSRIELNSVSSTEKSPSLTGIMFFLLSAISPLRYVSVWRSNTNKTKDQTDAIHFGFKRFKWPNWRKCTDHFPQKKQTYRKDSVHLPRFVKVLSILRFFPLSRLFDQKWCVAIFDFFPFGRVF